MSAVPSSIGTRTRDWALFSGLVTRGMGHSFLLVALPSLGRRFGFGDLQTGWLLSLGALGLLLTAPLWGSLAERVGRRRVLLLSMSAASVAPLLYGVLTWHGLEGGTAPLLLFWLFVGVRGLQALGSSGMLPAAQAWIADSTSPEGRTGGMGFMAAAFGLGGVLGSAVLFAVGGAAPHLGFLLIAGLTAASLLLCARALAEPKPPASPGGAGDWSGVSFRGLAPFLGVTFVGVMVYGVIQQVTGLRLQDDFGRDPLAAAGLAGGIMMVTAFAMVLAQGVGTRVLRVGPRRLLVVGALLGALAMVGLAQSRGLTLFTAAMVLLGFGLGLMLPANLAAMSLRTGDQGRTAGVNGAAQALGMVAGPGVGAVLYQHSTVTPYWGAAVLLGLVVAGSWRGPKRDTQGGWT
ncbi:MAG: MFS transporter [Acidobacteriota bacterium]